MYAWYFYLFLCHHDECSCGFLHSKESFTWGIGFYDAIIQFLFYFFQNAKLMQKSKYAKVKITHAMQKGKYG